MEWMCVHLLSKKIDVFVVINSDLKVKICVVE